MAFLYLMDLDYLFKSFKVFISNYFTRSKGLHNTGIALLFERTGSLAKEGEFIVSIEKDE